MNAPEDVTSPAMQRILGVLEKKSNMAVSDISAEAFVGITTLACGGYISSLKRRQLIYISGWRKIKGRFTHATGLRGIQTHSKQEKGEAGLWQRRFWEHLIRDPDEEARAIAFCHSDPVRHGLVDAAAGWPFSTVHRGLRTMVGGSPTLRAASVAAVA